MIRIQMRTMRAKTKMKKETPDMIHILQQFNPLSIYTHLFSPSNSQFLFCNCYCMHICIFIYIPKYSIFSLCNATWLHGFRTDALALEKTS